MNEIFFIGDTHFGHKNILKFEPEKRKFDSIEEHDEYIVSQWNKTVSKKDTVWHLGDVMFGQDNIELLGRLNGLKKLVMGNHDSFQIERYAKYFNRIFGVGQCHGFVLTHIPVETTQFFRWKGNIHGHTHSRVLDDPRYFNVCCEQINMTPISYDELSEKFYDRMFKDGQVEQ